MLGVGSGLKHLYSVKSDFQQFPGFAPFIS